MADADEYDVKAKIEVDGTAGFVAVKNISKAFLALNKDVLNVAASISAAIAGMQPTATALGTALSGAFNTVKPAAVAVRTAISETTQSMKGLEVAAVSGAEHITTALKGIPGAYHQTTSGMAALERANRRNAASFASTAQIGRQAAGNLGGALRQALAFGGAYLGIRAMTNAFSGLLRSSFAFGDQMDRNRIALSAVLAATQQQFKGMPDPMAAAGRVGSAVFRQLEKDALVSVAASSELISMYSQIAGPLSGAGAKLSDIRSITNDAVSAAAVLGVDFAQASRDVNLMATGVAGQDTALFRMLRATGAITKNTQEWNTMMQTTPTKGLKELQAALAQFRSSAAVYAQSLPGLTSSFGDFITRFRTAFMSGPLEALRKMLARLVDMFARNEPRITAMLTAMGNAFASFLEPAMSAVERFTTYLVEHWEDIAARIERATIFAANVRSTAAHYAPTLKVAAAGMIAARVAPGALGAVASPITGAIGSGAGALGTALAETASVVVAMGGLGLVLGVVAAAAVLVAGVFGLMSDSWSHLVPVFGVLWGFLQELIGSFWGLLTAMLGAIMPLIKTLLAIGGILAFVVGGVLFLVIRILAELVMLALKGWTLIFEYLGGWIDWIYQKVLSVFTALADAFGFAFKDLLPNNGAASGGGGFLDGFLESVNKVMSGFKERDVEDAASLAGAEKGAPGGRKTTINDFRGSKIEVKQDFRNADPDRVWLQMVDGINGAAEQRLSSALVPDFTR